MDWKVSVTAMPPSLPRGKCSVGNQSTRTDASTPVAAMITSTPRRWPSLSTATAGHFSVSVSVSVPYFPSFSFASPSSPRSFPSSTPPHASTSTRWTSFRIFNPNFSQPLFPEPCLPRTPAPSRLTQSGPAAFPKAVSRDKTAVGLFGLETVPSVSCVPRLRFTRLPVPADKDAPLPSPSACFSFFQPPPPRSLEPKRDAPVAQASCMHPLRSASVCRKADASRSKKASPIVQCFAAQTNSRVWS
mmetsp:Transcript_12396/g.41207  ORF Transcript_12396/g.41207 Transcript_12396/m.41207 type:complete len:245 (+) Transcript_12396:524-1258(+)